MKLNLGCARDIKDGYLNIDMFHTDPRVKIADVSNLDFLSNGSVDHILAKDVLEHMVFKVAVKAMSEWARVLKKNGTILLQTTNIEMQFEALKQKVWDIPTFNYMLFGGKGYIDGQIRIQDRHGSVFTESFLRSKLSSLGIEVLSVKKDQIDGALRSNPRHHNLNITIKGRRK